MRKEAQNLLKSGQYFYHLLIVLFSPLTFTKKCGSPVIDGFTGCFRYSYCALVHVNKITNIFGG